MTMEIGFELVKQKINNEFTRIFLFSICKTCDVFNRLNSCEMYLISVETTWGKNHET